MRFIVSGGAAVLFASSSAYMAGTSLDDQIAQATSPDTVPSLLALSPDPSTVYAVAKRAVQLLVKREARGFGSLGFDRLNGPASTDAGRGNEFAEPAQ